MASINGMTVKNLELFYGNRGECFYRGDVYIGDERLGFWSQKDGGGDDFQFDTKRAEKVVDECIEYFVKIQKETDVSFTLSNLLQEIVYNIEAERLFERNRQCGACAVILTAGDRCLSAEVMMNHEMTESYKKFLEDDMCAYNSYKFGEEMPDWACEHIVSWVYYPGQFDPVYTKEGRKYT